MDNKDKRDMLPEDEYLKQMSSLPKVKAPDDFLQKVRARIERRPLRERVIDALFVPFRIKIPLEVAAVTATLLLVISTLEVTKPVKVLRQEPSAPKSDVEEAVVGKAEAEKADRKGYTTKAYDAVCADKFAFEYSGVKDEAVLKNEMSAPQEMKSVVAPEVELEEKPAVPRAAGSGAGLEYLKMKKAERVDGISTVKDRIASVKGKITHIETDVSTGRVKYIDAEIPSAKYEEFRKSIEGPVTSGEIKMQPILKDSPQGSNIIQIRIFMI